MNFEFSEDQRLLKETVDRFAAQAGGLEPHRAAARSDRGWSHETWDTMAELGLLSIAVAEDAGGLGGGGPELMILGEAVGRHLMTEPVLQSAIVAGSILSGAEQEVRDPAVEGLLDGSVVYALVEGAVGGDAAGLTGSASGVCGGGQADQLIVCAGQALYLIAGTADGVLREDYPLHGGGRGADIHFDRAPAILLIGEDRTGPILARAAQRRVAFLVAEMLGAAEAAFEATVEHLKTRVQFGQAIGSNQALQHRAAEMAVEIEQLRSAAILGACALDELDPLERPRVMAEVALVASKAGRFVGQQAVQLHGGVGVTEEHLIGRWFLRITAIGLKLGGDAKRAQHIVQEVNGPSRLVF